MLTVIMGFIVVLAITREGSEVLIYLNNFTQTPDLISVVLSGAVIGAGIGCSVGIIVYYLLCNIAPRWSMNAGIVLLILISSGMISQASLLLIQADWLPSQLPLWDSSHYISEQSVVGQLLYAVMGYEATPTPVQAGFYFSGLLLSIMLFFFANKFPSSLLNTDDQHS
jgi:high-affinity iron transporter